MGKAAAMGAGGWLRNGLAVGAASVLAGCVEPAYVSPGPIQLQQYPPAVSYQSMPGSYPLPSGPIPLQAAPPPVEPLPPAPAPSVTELPPGGDNGAIPVQDMPAPATDTPAPAVVSTTPDPAAPDPAAATPAPATGQAFKAPTSGPGSNVPLEGFRPMRGQTRPTP